MTMTIKSQKLATCSVELQWQKHGGFEVVVYTLPDKENYVRRLKVLSYMTQKLAEAGFKRQVASLSN